MIKKPKLLYFAAGAAVVGIGLFAALSPAEARPRGGKHLHFQHFQHRFHAERHIYVVPVIKPRVVKNLPKVAPTQVAATNWVKKCGETPDEA